MKNSVVTGASSGIGRACSIMLLNSGYAVYGVARDFSRCDIDHEAFTRCACDLTDSNGLSGAVADIRHKIKGRLHLLLNCAGSGAFAPHEEISPEQICGMLNLNLGAPLVLASLFLRDIKRAEGFIINISSITAMQPAPRGCAYGATKAGLLHFSRSLFEETRRAGVRVVCIMPDITRTPFFDGLDFGPADDPDTFIQPECVARAVREVINQREGTVITEMVIRPRRFMLEKRRGRSAGRRRHEDAAGE